MDKFVVASLRQGAGKTSVIIGMAKVLGRKIGYIKPFGERFLYRKKRLWDYDAALITNLFGLDESPENMSIGFHHSKLISMLDEGATCEKLQELMTSEGEGKEIFFAECGKDITYGVSVYLDALTVARNLNAPLIVVAGGGEDEAILDDIVFFKNYIRMGDVRCKGIIINKVAHVSDFCETHLPRIVKHGIDVLGVIPYCRELTLFSAGYLADRLFAKIVSGEEQLDHEIRNIFIGTMSADVALKNPAFREQGNVVITSGDRSDMIIAALENKAAAIVLTDNIHPPSNLISLAAESKVPLLLVSADTREIAGQIAGMESLLTKDDPGKIALIEQMVREHVNLQALLQP